MRVSQGAQPPNTNGAPGRGSLLLRKDVISWSLYDFANTIFSMNIVSSFFKPWVVEDLGRPGYTFDIAVSLAMLAVAVLSPALGALADHGAKKKLFLGIFTISAIVSLTGFSLLPPSAFVVIIILFAVSNFFYEGGMVFYNSLLYSLTTDDSQARYISGVGVAWGYVGTIVGLFAMAPFVERSGNSGAFLPTAALFFLFSLPLFLFVRERPALTAGKIKLKEAYRYALGALTDSEKYPGLLRFLTVDFLVKNAMNAVILNIGMYTSAVMGLDAAGRIPFLATVTLSAVIGSFVIGKLSVRADLRKMIIIVALAWIVCLVGLGLADSRALQWSLASLAGVLLGAVWTLHRPYIAELVPSGERGRFFGLYSITGKSAAVVGPLWWALFFKLFQADGVFGSPVAAALSLSEAAQEQLPYRAAAASLSLLVIAGVIIFMTGQRRVN